MFRSLMMRDATLTAARMLSPSVRELTLAPGHGFSFVAGQWVSLRIPQPNGEEIGRSYSIASAPRPDGSFEIAVTRVASGPGSTFLHDVSPGTVLRITQAQGFFTLGPPIRPVLMVGTGTGVAPLRSMLHAAAREADPLERVPHVLLFGARTEHDVLYREDFTHLASSWPEFRFVPTLSRPLESWSGLRGYVQLHVPALVHELGGDCDVYVCGLNHMVREVRAVLKEQLGLTRDRIHTERYD